MTRHQIKIDPITSLTRFEQVGEFYDVREERVEILAVVPKSQAQAWLNQRGSEP